jgi:prepilin-type N-terminal cleavage/methylation domain-containing protein
MPGLSERRGFSLVEMMVVVMIGGVLGAMSFGKINLINNDRRLNSAMSAVQNDIEMAFNLAARDRVPMRLTWTPSAMTMTLTDRAGTKTFRTANLSSEYGLRSSSNVTFSLGNSTTPAAPYEVYPNGLAIDTLLITLTKNGVTKKVWVSRAGMVQLRY